MASKSIWTVKLSDTLELSECRDGYWLYDHGQIMNLSMRAKTERDAFVEAIGYYQRLTNEISCKHKALNDSVQQFVSSIDIEE